MPTSTLLAPLLDGSYKFSQPVYVLLQNGLDIEKDLYSAAAKLGQGIPQIFHAAIWIASNLVASNIVVHGNSVGRPVNAPCCINLMPQDRMSLGIYRAPPDKRKTNDDIEAAILNDFAEILRDGGGDVTVVGEIQSVKYAKNYW
jgi:2-dehydropantoate 2-reductase